MLKSISCDIFNVKDINFHKGLNTICGDDIASNSIGKTSMLMIIDFIFGGTDYIIKNHDIIEHMGHHTFKFVFMFENIDYYFIRNTKDYTYVYECSESFTVKNRITIQDYNKWLQDKYCCNLMDLTFRNITGRYFRIYGKENLNERKPIQNFEKERSEDSIISLIKLFNKYSTLVKFRNELNSIKNDKSILMNAAKKSLIPLTTTKKKYELNSKEINSLDFKLNQLKNDIKNSTLDLNSILTAEIQKLSIKKRELNQELIRLENQLKRTNNNVINKPTDIKNELKEFIYYFPDFNVSKIYEIEEFHKNISKILNKEFLKIEKDLSMRVESIKEEISSVDNQINDQIQKKDVSELVLNEIVDIAARRNQLIESNDNYKKMNDLHSNIKSGEVTYKKIKESLLDDICGQINNEMYDLNKRIYEDKRKAPTLNIHGNNYSFNTAGDTGTGTAYANLIEFDLSILKLTCLPALIHDLPILKNIENYALENIITLYNESQKQIFIAIDKLNSYDEKASRIIKNNEVLFLSKDKLLFKKNWKNAS